MITPIFTTKVGDTKPKMVGILDTEKRLYQSAGDLGKLVYWKHRAFTFTPKSWVEISNRADIIEIIDKKKNEVYFISTEQAKKDGYLLQGELGEFWGIPLDSFQTRPVDRNLADELK